MNNVDDFFNNAKERDLCERGAKIWGHCRSKKSLIDFALGSWGADYLCKAIVEGWGISPQSIQTDFAPFINGKYTRDRDGYTSRIYCGFDGPVITVGATLTIVINFEGTIWIPHNRVCELYLCNSEVKIDGDGEVVVNMYKSSASVPKDSEVKMTPKNGI